MQSSNRRQLLLAVVLIASGPAIFFAVWLAANRWLDSVTRGDPVPNQGAMVCAFLACVASLPFALTPTIYGLVMAIRLGWKAIREANESEAEERALKQDDGK